MNANPELIAEAIQRKRDGFKYVVLPGGATGVECDAVLADAYLASHRGDDGAALTEEWLRSVGFKPWSKEEDAGYDLYIRMRDELGWECRLAYQSNGFYAVRMCEEPEGDYAESVELLGTRNMKPAVTRGQLRQLCKCLGIPLKENSDG